MNAWQMGHGSSGPHSNLVFHTLCVAIAGTGITMLLTGGDLGPYAPLLIAFGLYALVFTLLAEGVFLTYHVVRKSVQHFRRNRRPADVGTRAAAR